MSDLGGPSNDPITLQQATAALNAWLQAELNVSTGQSYKIGKRELTRAHMREISERINFWRSEVVRLSSGRRPGARVFSIIPRDL